MAGTVFQERETQEIDQMLNVKKKLFIKTILWHKSHSGSLSRLCNVYNKCFTKIIKYTYKETMFNYLKICECVKDNT